jgi:hypothetical protein
VDRCPACDRFFVSGLALPERLRTDVSEETPYREILLTERVMEAVTDWDKITPKPRISFSSSRQMMAIAACLTLLVMGGLLYLNPQEKTQPSEKDMASTIGAVTDLGRNLWNAHLERKENHSWMAYMTEPLTAEVERLTKDAESIRGFFFSALPLRFLSRFGEADE